jgi:uncharacterized protein
MRRFFFTTAALALCAVFAVYGSAKSVTTSPLASTTVVINEVYGGAGCGTAGCSTYNRDFIELKNIGATVADISGWSVQYTSAAGSAWQVTAIPANTAIRPGDTFLIAESTGGAGTGVNTINFSNVSGTIAMSATAAKVALVSNSTALTGTCPTDATIVDFIGYGAANCNGSLTNTPATNAPAPSTTTSDQRNAAGLDTDIDSANFTASAPTPAAALLPTAASATISGRVITSDGAGIARAAVQITDQSGAIRTALSNGFGYFTFDEIVTGQTYVLSVRSKQYQFGQSTQVVTANDAIDNVVFTANP